MKVGFIGLGIMGSGMATNLLKAGHEVVAYNRTLSKAEALVASGVTVAVTVEAVGKEVDVVITMLAHPEAVRAVAADLIPALSAGSLWVDCSTTHSSFVREMAAQAAQHGVRFVDAPVAGSKHQAADAQLAFFCGGNSAEISRATPLYEGVGHCVVHVGDHGMGTALKLIINHLLATSMAAFAEGLALGESLGLSREMLLNALVGAVVTAPYMASKKDKLASGDYEVEFPLKWMQKDMQMVATAAYKSGVPMPLANLTKELFQAAVARGLGDQDFSAVGA